LKHKKGGYFMILGAKIQRLRKEKGMSQEQLAAQLTISRQAISKWELGEAMPDTDNIVQLSKLFDVSTDYLLIDEIEMSNAQEITIPNDSESKTISPVKKNRTKQYRAIRTSVAVMLFLLFPFWPRTIPYDIRTFLGIMGFIIGIGLLIYNRLTRAKKEK